MAIGMLSHPDVKVSEILSVVVFGFPFLLLL